MSLIFSSIVPHPPILIPEIGKENLRYLKNTQKAYEKLKIKLEKLKPETIIIISHNNIQENIFTINLSPRFKANFEEFGNFSVKKEWKGDLGFSAKLSESLETENNLSLVNNENINHAISIPLFLLTENLKNTKIIPISFSGLNRQKHFEFGKLLKKEIINSEKKIAVVVSGDLSHRLNKKSPGGYSPKAKKFDKKIIDFLLKKKIKKILEIDEDIIRDAQEYGFKSILILLGILHNINFNPKLLSYEAPFGVGYLLMDFQL